MTVFTYKDKAYPDYIRRGNAVEHIVPTAKKFCIGDGLDIGGLKDWSFPGANLVNPAENEFNAMHLPQKEGGWDYIFSSHCLEHVPNYIEALETWRAALRCGGQLFLYLPHPEMAYWKPQNCRKHLHEFQPKQMADILYDLGFRNIFHSERDLYWSFAVTGVKPWE